MIYVGHLQELITPTFCLVPPSDFPLKTLASATVTTLTSHTYREHELNCIWLCFDESRDLYIGFIRLDAFGYANYTSGFHSTLRYTVFLVFPIVPFKNWQGVPFCVEDPLAEVYRVGVIEQEIEVFERFCQEVAGRRDS